MMSRPPKPRNRNDLKIAIVCALPLEAELVRDVFDQEWKHLNIGRVHGDHNSYTLGVIGHHNVVLVHMPGIGNVDAANAAGSLKKSFPNIAIAFVTGICGASPKHIDTEESIFLGDCIVSTALIQFDFGRQYPGEFTAKSDIEHVLGRAGPAARSFLAKLQTSQTRTSAEEGLAFHLDLLQKRNHRASNPGPGRDRRFDSNYLHTHHDGQTCEKCIENTGICSRECDELGCYEQRPAKRAKLMSNSYSDIPHEALEDSRLPRLYFGRYGSANTVLRSGLDRDTLVAKYKLVAFEMEGAGFWEHIPTLVIKSACDYADSHKNKEWQGYAAAVAAAALKSILAELELLDEADAGSPTLTANDGITEAVREADAAIRLYYNSSNRLQIERLSGAKLPLQQCYINLGITNRSDHNQQNEDKNETSFILAERLRVSAIRAGDSLSLETLFKNKILPGGKIVTPRRIFIQGRAGIGKTTLCKKIVHEFLNDKLWTDLFDRLLWIPFRSLKSKTTEFGWQDLLQDVYSPRVENWKELARTISRQLLKTDFLNRTLLLFDGLDEINHRWSREDKMFEFVEGVICDAPNVIVTSRPQANSFDVGHFDLEAETTGFTSDQINAYLKNCVKDENIIFEMETLIAQQPLLQGLFTIPIQLDAFCCTWSTRTVSNGNMRNAAQPNIPTAILEGNLSTMTTLYQSITSELYRKDVERLDKVARSRRLTGVRASSLLRDELHLLEEYAFQGMLNGIHNFTPHDRNVIESHMSRIKSQARELDSFVLERLSFLRTSDIEQHYSQKNYHFLHLTFQEFFAARHFVRLWRVDRDLVCLDLRGLSDKSTELMSPTKFLQTKKYTPQLNIFWRFVTGLVQILTYDDEEALDSYKLKNQRKDIVGFFEQLNTISVDLLGPAHRRLLMCCLTELLPSTDEEIKQLRTTEELLLKQWTNREHRMDYLTDWGQMAEFPENILCELLQSRNGLSKSTALPALNALNARSFVSTQTLNSVAEYLHELSPTEVRSAAINVILKNSRRDSQKLVAQAAQSFLGLSTDSNSGIRKSAIKSLADRLPLPISVSAALIAALDDQDWEVGFQAAEKLRRNQALPAEIITAQFIAFTNKHESPEKRTTAAKVFGTQRTLSVVDLIALMTVIQDQCEAPIVRKAGAEALEYQATIPTQVIIAMTSVLENEEDENLKESIARRLDRADLTVPAEAISAMIRTLLKEQNEEVRMNLIHAIILRSPLPAEAVATMIAALDSEDYSTRRIAGLILKSQRYLPTEATAPIVKALEDQNLHVRRSAVLALGCLQSLSPEIVAALVRILNDIHLDIRDVAAEVLGKHQSLPPEAVLALISALYDGNFLTRLEAAKALRSQLSLSAEAVAALTTAFENKDVSTIVSVREIVAQVLGREVVQPSIAALISTLDHGREDERETAAAALEAQPSLPAEVINSLLVTIQKRPGLVMDIFCKHGLLQTAIRRLESDAHKLLWRYWLHSTRGNDTYCYEHADCLHLWWKGKLYKISANFSETQGLLRSLREMQSRSG